MAKPGTRPVLLFGSRASIASPEGDVSAPAEADDALNIMKGIENELRRDWKLIVECREQFKRHYSGAGLHSLRIGIRRLQTMARIMGRIGMPAAPPDLMAALWAMRYGSGLARDIDVLLADVLPKFVAKTGCSRWPGPGLNHHLVAYRESVRSGMRQVVIRGVTDALELKLQAWLEAISTNARVRGLDTGLFSEEIQCTFKRAVRIAGHLRRCRKRDLHKYRIRLKKLRYASELFAACVPASTPRPWIGALVRMQNELGKAHDAYAGWLQLRKFPQAKDDAFLEAFGHWSKRTTRKHMRRAGREWKRIKVHRGESA